ncbi:MAG: ATP-binding protein [Chloroflexi bacterium]|nr:ATP-binding protein [Chloroflexota bacterium]
MRWRSTARSGAVPRSRSASGAAEVSTPVRVSVSGEVDVEWVRREARSFAGALGFDPVDTERVALAVLELATNLVRYAPGGEIVLSIVDDERGAGVQIESCDRGPGIPDLGRALKDGFSTGGGLGNGLPGVRRLMDDFEISSSAEGTTVIARKWPKQPRW